MTKNRKVLVFGARKDSLGYACWAKLRETGIDTVRAGVSDEEVILDIGHMGSLRAHLWDAQYTDIICTVGTNQAHGIYYFDHALFRNEMVVNVEMPLRLLHAWITNTLDPVLQNGHFVGISSNSAHIARSDSLGYCASKAALSMGLRCAARKMAGRAVVYGYEPGWLEGTPMSEAVSKRLGRGVPPHRIPGGQGIDPTRLAQQIVGNLLDGGPELNGTMIRIDGGEQ